MPSLGETFSTSSTSRGRIVGTMDSEGTTESVTAEARTAALSRPPTASNKVKPAVSRL